MNNGDEKQTFQVFCSYSHEDRTFQDSLAKHLASLRRIGLIELWYDKEIRAGDKWADEISENLEKADIVLLLVSANFIASDYCYAIEMKRALELHDSEQATAIPIIIKPCDWTITPIGALQALPSEAKPVSSWNQADEAWTDVSRGLRRTIEKLEQKRLAFKVVSKGSTGTTRSMETRSYRSLDVDDYTVLLLRFLDTWRTWSFSISRIRGWGGRQPGFEELADIETGMLKSILKKLEQKGIVVSLPGPKSGSLLYHLKGVLPDPKKAE